MTESTGHREQIQMYLNSEVDMNALDRTLALHPFLYQLATDDMHKLQTWVDKAKAKLELVRATASSQYRAAVENETGKKPTERQIEEFVVMHELTQEAQDEYFEALDKYRACKQLEESFRQREASIKNLCSLYASQYWSMHSLESDVEKQAAVIQKNN